MLRIMEKWQKGKHRPGITLGGLAEEKLNLNKQKIYMLSFFCLCSSPLRLSPAWPIFSFPPTNCAALCAAGLHQTWTSLPSLSLVFISTKRRNSSNHPRIENRDIKHEEKASKCLATGWEGLIRQWSYLLKVAAEDRVMEEYRRKLTKAE